MQAQILAPAAALIAWSLIILFLVPITRLPALKKLGSGLNKAEPGARGQDVESQLPAKVRWISHNYSHLMEQPTIFYPTVLIIAILGANAGDVLAAWIYVGFRVTHSLWQILINIVLVRFALFLGATTALVFLIYRAVSLTLFANPGVLS